MICDDNRRLMSKKTDGDCGRCGGGGSSVTSSRVCRDCQKAGSYMYLNSHIMLLFVL